MICKYCGEEFETNARGKKKDYCNKPECIRQAKNEAQRKWYANKMQVLKGTKARIIEQKDEKKVVYSSTDRAINELNNGNFQDVRECARELGAVRFKIVELIKKLSQEQSLYDKYDQDFLHKIEEFAKQDELKEDEVLEVVREHVNRRSNRRVVKDKEEMLKHLIQGLNPNPEQYVVQSINDRKNRIYKPRVKEASLGTKRSHRSEESKLKQKTNLDEKKIAKNENQNKVIQMKQEIIEKEYKSNLKEHLEQKLFDLIYKFKHTERGQELTTMQIREMLSQKSVAGASPKYSNTELAIVFDYYRQCINEINKYKMYLPTKKNFCSFAGISSSQYDMWRKSQDDERADIMQKIDDYITDIQLTSAQNGDIKEISTIYRTKSEHGMVEATAPIVVEHKSEVNTANILKQIEALKKGQSLIELKEQPDGTYKAEDNE